MAAAPSMIKLYGVPLSQPFRSVAWTLLQLELPFGVELAVPGMASKIGTKHENYRNLTPHRSTQVPLLIYEDAAASSPVALTESPAIMSHLCELFGPSSTTMPSLYPASGSVAKAKVDSYLHWHHSNTRQFARLVQPQLRPDLKLSLSEQDHIQFQELLQTLNSGWLNYDGRSDFSVPLYIGGLDHPTIADILAYGELSAVTMTNLLQVSQDDYPLLHTWMAKMAQLPHHDHVHQALTTLGDLSVEEDPKSIGKRLGAATKAGMQGIADAQASYSSGD